MPYFVIAALLGSARARRRPLGPELLGRELAVAIMEELWLVTKAALLPLTVMSAAAVFVAVAFGTATPGPVLATSIRSTAAVATAGAVGVIWLVVGRRRPKRGIVDA